jgi:hypothetical protein
MGRCSSRPVLPCAYLRGPLTRSQVRALWLPIKGRVNAAAASRGASSAAPFAAQPIAQGPEAPLAMRQCSPRVNARLAQYFAPAAISEDRIARDLASRYGRAVRNREMKLSFERTCWARPRCSMAIRRARRSSEHVYPAWRPTCHVCFGDWGQYLLKEFNFRTSLRRLTAKRSMGRCPKG